MPTRSIYIRNADLELWESCEDKTEKVSQMLNQQSFPTIVLEASAALTPEMLKPSPYMGAGVITDEELNAAYKRVVVENPVELTIGGGDVEGQYPIRTLRNKDMDFCKHNAVKGLCKKGCR